MDIVTYFSTSSIFTRCSNFDFITIFFYKWEKKKVELKNPWWELKMHWAVIFLSSLSQTSWCEWHKRWKKSQVPSIKLYCQHDLHAYYSVHWVNERWLEMWKYIKDDKTGEGKKLASHLSCPLYFQRASVSPEPALERWRLYDSISSPAHQNCNSNKLNTIKTKQ